MSAKKPLVLDAFGTWQQLQAGDFVDIPQGGTGATNASGARANLGLAIGTNVEAWSAELDALAAISATGFPVRTAAATYASRSLIAPSAGISITNPDGVAGNPTFALTNDLNAIESLNGTGFYARTASDTWAALTLSTASSGRITIANGNGVGGNPVFDLAVTGISAGTYKSVTVDTYGRVTAGTNPTTLAGYGITDALPLSGGTLTNTLTLAADPVNPLDAATKQYVDARAAGLDPKASVKVVAATNITLSGAQTIDGVSVAVGDRVLVVGQTAPTDNGIYLCASGAWTRTSDFNSSTNITSGAYTFVSQGAAYANSGWVLQNTGGTVTVGTTSLNFVQFTGAGEINASNGIVKTGNTLAVGITSRLQFTSGSVDLNTSGVAAGTYTKLTVDAYGRAVAGATATASDVGAQASSSELTALSSLATTGMLSRTSAGTYATRSLVAPSAGLTITNGDGVAGSPTFAFANDLGAIEALNGTGIYVRTGTDTWAARQVTVASNSRLTVTNPYGTAGDITLDLASSGVAPGTYTKVTVDTYGRVTAGSGGSGPDAAVVGLGLTNGEAASMTIGQPVYVSGGGTVKKAIANAAGSKDVVGLVFDTSISASAVGNIATSGTLSATTGQWDAITGQTGGLTVGALYFLSNSTAGMITSTVPTSGYVCKLGIALSATQLRITIGTPVQL